MPKNHNVQQKKTVSESHVVKEYEKFKSEIDSTINGLVLL